jgi:hypothetical protein
VGSLARYTRGMIQCFAGGSWRFTSHAPMEGLLEDWSVGSRSDKVWRSQVLLELGRGGWSLREGAGRALAVLAETVDVFLVTQVGS